jgi:hypothetical protein
MSSYVESQSRGIQANRQHPGTLISFTSNERSLELTAAANSGTLQGGETDTRSSSHGMMSDKDDWLVAVIPLQLNMCT